MEIMKYDHEIYYVDNKFLILEIWNWWFLYTKL
jgi:hypothetical protein